ncbi:MAG: rod-binding protein [Desulfococcaceae bacterium]
MTPFVAPPGPTAPALSTASGTDDREQLRARCAEMEALFLNHLMKAMRQTVPEDDAGFGRETWTAMRDAELSRTLAAERGFGLQELLMRQLAPEDESSDPADDSSSAPMSLA